MESEAFVLVMGLMARYLWLLVMGLEQILLIYCRTTKRVKLLYLQGVIIGAVMLSLSMNGTIELRNFPSVMTCEGEKWIALVLSIYSRAVHCDNSIQLGN